MYKIPPSSKTPTTSFPLKITKRSGKGRLRLALPKANSTLSSPITKGWRVGRGPGPVTKDMGWIQTGSGSKWVASPQSTGLKADGFPHMFNKKWQQLLCSCNRISHGVSREMDAGSLDWSRASQAGCSGRACVCYPPAADGHTARTGRCPRQSSKEGLGGAAKEASAEAILHTHAAPCPRPHCGLSAAQAAGADASRHWQKQRLGLGSSPQKDYVPVRGRAQCLLLLDLSREGSLPRLNREKGRCLHAQCPLREVGIALGARDQATPRKANTLPAQSTVSH